MSRILFPRIERLGICQGCRREDVALYRSKVLLKLICRVCLVQTREIDQ